MKPLHCPKCGAKIPPKSIARHFAAHGGSAGVGKAKARTTAQARAAARARWAKHRAAADPAAVRVIVGRPATGKTAIEALARAAMKRQRNKASTAHAQEIRQ